ncbi:MAG TPA: C45 family peptidase [Candidatus Binataceae bacterium]|nr:C45 family peptidase [Candidatus Binataceae bacterium]
MATQTFPRLKLKGTAREIGRQHGAEFASRIHDNIKIYYRNFAHYASLDPETVFARAKTFIPIIEDFDRELMEEIRGIAEGAKARLEDVVAINARTEMMFKEGVKLIQAECTSLAATPEAVGNQHTLIGQNWDWMPQIQKNCVLLDIEQASKPRVITFTEAGIVGKIGMNSAGVGLCCNLLVGAETAPGVPFHLLCRGILNSSSMGDAVGVVFSNQSGACGNFLIGHGDGEAIDLENTPKGGDYLYGRTGVMSHTNHFESRVAVDDQGRKLIPDTILRYCRSGKLLDQEKGRVSPETFQHVFKDHFNYPAAICRHRNEALPEPEQLQTNASIIMDLTERVMMLCHGSPCKGEYQEISFTQ